MKRKLIPACALGIVALMATACGPTETYTVGVNLNYALLIGQIDHNDSAARTGGVRDALNTRAENPTSNANTENPVVGTLTVGGKTLTVTEVEHAEQRNTAGTAWDATTATNTTANWLAAHANDTWVKEDGSETKGQGINIFVSNNDGMAMAAINANGWVKGTPIFGYDANTDALEAIVEGKLMGTVSQNAPTQVASLLMLTRNLIDDVENPTTTGFSAETPNTTYGYVTQTTNYNSTHHSILADNVAVDSAEEARQWLLTPAEQVSTFEGSIKNGNKATDNRIFLNCYSNSDTFLNSTMSPLFQALLPMFDLTTGATGSTAYTVSGDGNTDTTITNNLTTVSDAYLLNIITPTAASQYLNTIAQLEGASATNPSDKPIIFWNRQPTKADGSVDTDIINDERFTNIYYVGFDANQGGEAQGQMVLDYITANISTLWSRI